MFAPGFKVIKMSKIVHFFVFSTVAGKTSVSLEKIFTYI